MADTKGLMQTRGEWTDARAAGETDLSHRDWYEQKYGPKAEQSAEESRKQVKAGYDKVAAKRMTTKVA